MASVSSISAKNGNNQCPDLWKEMKHEREEKAAPSLFAEAGHTCFSSESPFFLFSRRTPTIATLFFSLYFSSPKNTVCAIQGSLFPVSFLVSLLFPRRPTRSQRTILLRGVRCSFLLLLWLFNGTTFFYALPCRKRKPAASPQRCSLQNSWRGGGGGEWMPQQ